MRTCKLMLRWLPVQMRAFGKGSIYTVVHTATLYVFNCAMPYDPDPIDLAAAIEPHLEKGENLVWYGESAQRFFRVSFFAAVLFTAFLTLMFAFLLFLLFNASPGNGWGHTSGYLVVGVMAIFCGAMALFPWIGHHIASYLKRRFICFITDKRAASFFLSPGKKGRLTSFQLADLNRLKVKIYPDGYGNIVFKAQGHVFGVAWYGFYDIPEVETAMRHLSKLTGIEPIVRHKSLFGRFLQRLGPT